jgi:K+-sensing histidine kinase KdpD
MSSILPYLGYGSIPGFFASLIAFIITYDEYTKHYVDKRMPFRLALEAALFAFLVVLLLAIITGFILTKAFAS